MNEVGNIAVSTARGTEQVAPLAIRVSPHSYFVAIFLGTFLTAFLFYLENDVAAYVAFCISWLVLPFLAIRDRITFDGRVLIRTGLVPRLWRAFNGGRRRLRLIDIEQAETHALRTWRRGGAVHYRYRTSFRGKGVSLAIASGGESFRRIAKAILSKLPDSALDIRSLELRDYLQDPTEAVRKAEAARLPSGEVIDRGLRDHDRPKRSVHVEKSDASEGDEMRRLGNELRIAGRLARSVEAFRRGLRHRPQDGWLLFGLARSLQSLSAIHRERRLERRSLAALRLAELRANDDGELLARIGEAFHQLGAVRHADRVFKRAVDSAAGSFRAAKGLAEIALQDGKIAHVIHHFAAAAGKAETAALRRWAKGEAEYFSNLNSDDEYMETEVHRVQMVESMERAKRMALRISLYSFPLVTVGILFEDTLVANIGWTVSGVSLIVWTLLVVMSRLLSRRIPYDLVADDEN